MNPSGAVPLVGVVTMRTNTPAFASLTVTDDRNGGGFRVEFPDPQTEHALQVLGLKPERTYTIAVAAALTRGGAPLAENAALVALGPYPTFTPLDVKVVQLTSALQTITTTAVPGPTRRPCSAPA